MAKSGVVETNGDVLRGIMGSVDAIGDIRDVCESLESVGASVGDVQRHLPVPLEFEALPVPIGGRVWPQVDDDVVDRPVGASHQLCLPGATSDVKTPHHTLDGPRDAVLSERVRIYSRVAGNLGIEGSAEEPSFVHDRCGFEQERPGDALDSAYLHVRCP